MTAVPRKKLVEACAHHLCRAFCQSTLGYFALYLCAAFAAKDGGRAGNRAQRERALGGAFQPRRSHHRRGRRGSSWIQRLPCKLTGDEPNEIRYEREGETFSLMVEKLSVIRLCQRLNLR